MTFTFCVMLCNVDVSEEIDWIKNNNLEYSLGERCKMFQKQFDKTITKAYLSKLLV